MAAVTVRNIPDEVHRALKARARSHGRSTEAEIREILRDAVIDQAEIGIGTRLAALAAKHGHLDDDDVVFARDQTEPRVVDFT